MKCSLGISDFLEDISSLSYSTVFLYFFALITRKAFLSLLAILWNAAFKWIYYLNELNIQNSTFRKVKWLSEEVLQIAQKRKNANGKGERKDIPIRIEFQRIRRDKKAFLSDQCEEIEENNRMGKTRDLFKKIRDTKGTFHAKMGSIKDRNGLDLTEAEDIKRWQEDTEELYKKIFTTQIIMMV